METATMNVQQGTKLAAAGSQVYEVAHGVWGLRILFVNVYFVATHSGKGSEWVLIDAGLKGYDDRIIAAAESLFGPRTRPQCIILTHGHFDHVGALQDLLQQWHVPVYAHKLELPYLDGRSAYPPADPAVGGGLMAWSAWLYPNKPINVSKHLHTLAADHKIEQLHEWKWVHTPGHSPGHVSLFRVHDRVLLAGDAVVTTQQESAIAVMMQKQKLCGPPAYFTTDWEAAAHSMQVLGDLQPEVIAAGHGMPMRGIDMRRTLNHLASHFKQEVQPRSGRYVKEPARADANGTTYVPPQDLRPVLVAGAIGIAAVAAIAYGMRRRSGHRMADKILKGLR